MAGEGAYSNPLLQAQFPREAYAQIRHIALRAVRKIPASRGEGPQSFVKVLQGADEPYADFIDRLQATFEQQFDNDDARGMLLLQLAVENANNDCKRVLQNKKTVIPLWLIWSERVKILAQQDTKLML